MVFGSEADVRDMEIGSDLQTALDLCDRRVIPALVRDIVDDVDARQAQIAVIEHTERCRRGIVMENAAFLGKRLVVDIMRLDALEFEILSG